MNSITTPSQELIVPTINPADIRVFLVEDAGHKREAVLASLAFYGVGEDAVTTATTFEEAEMFMFRQQPGQLEANVFILDGNLDETQPSASWQGRHLAGQLFRKYSSPLRAILDQAAVDLHTAGASKSDVLTVMADSGRNVYNLALNQLHREAFLTGISIDSENTIHIGQVPWSYYGDVGKIVFDAVVPRPIRRQFEREKLREEQRANADTVRAERAARRAAAAPVQET